jgi:uncharacterized membrane protein YfhO
VEKIPKTVAEGVLIDGPVPPEFHPGPSDCGMSRTRIEPNTFVVDVSAQSMCFLFVTDKYFPGWQVYVNGKRERLYRANRIFKGVFVDAGQNQVRFEFVPTYFFAAVAASVSTVLLLAGRLFVWPYFRNSATSNLTLGGP